MKIGVLSRNFCKGPCCKKTDVINPPKRAKKCTNQIKSRKQNLCKEKEEEEEEEGEMAWVTTGFWCSSNVKMPMLSSMSSPRISCRSIPMPPLNARDPFLPKLVSVANSKNPETPSHFDLFGNPKITANTDQVN